MWPTILSKWKIIKFIIVKRTFWFTEKELPAHSVLEGRKFQKNIVLGHEIAHAVAKHSAEQMSKQKNQSILTSLGASILAVKAGQEAANMATSLASTGLTFLNAHYSRDNESEADHMGLIFAAMAGYDPNTAISFWKRMSQASSGSASTSILQSYLSSHPSDAKRVTDIQRWLPEAMKYYTGK